MAKEDRMIEKISVWLLATVILTSVCDVQAQQVAKKAQIGFLVAVSSSASAVRLDTFRQGLRELGYEDDKNIIMTPRYAEGRLERLPALAAELVRLKPAVIVSAGGQATRAAKDVTKVIPIVMTNDPAPVAAGFVASLARPCGNITGVSTLAPELAGKRLELLSEIVPKLSRVAVVGTSSQPGHAQTIKELELAATAFKLHTQYLDVIDPNGVDNAFQAAAKGRADAILTLTRPILRAARARIADLAIKLTIPVIYNDIQSVDAGGLIFYGVSFQDLDRRAAIFVDKILKGAKPADLPVEQPKKFDFVVNLKAAKQIGLTIPPNVLARAERVIR
jgi:putative ABC transport system substrate-binding protein